MAAYWVNDVWDRVQDMVPFLMNSGLKVLRVGSAQASTLGPVMQIETMPMAEWTGTPQEQAEVVRSIFGDNVSAVDAWQILFKSDGWKGDPYLELFYSLPDTADLVVSLRLPYSEELAQLLGVSPALRQVAVGAC